VTHLDELEPMIQSIAGEFGRKHRQHGAEPEDFAQQMRVWVLENEEKVTEWLNPDLFSEKDSTRLIAASLRNESKDYAVDVKSQALGYERADLVWYSKNEVRALLPSVFNQDAWHEPPRSEGRSTKAPSEGGNWLATLADVAQGLEKLDLYDRSILTAFHKDHWTNKEMAEREGVSEQVMSYHHDRAIHRLVKALGDTAPRPMRTQEGRDPWRGRKAVSSAHARAIAGANYDDE
jgi:hypothetical protein